jgi:hypothetical protein
MSKSSVAVLATALLLAGCSGPAVLSASQSQSAEATSGVMELAATADPLAPGRYTRASFEPAVTFTLDEGWRGVQLLSGFFDVQQQVGTPQVIAVQFAQVSAVFSGSGSEAVTDAEQAARLLARNDDFEILGTSAAQVGGLSGFAVELANATDHHVSVLVVPPGPLGIDPHRRLWVSLFNTPQGLVAVMVGGADENWDEALATAEPVLESVEFAIP